MASGVEAFSLYAKLILDSSEYEKSLSESEHKASGFGSKLASGLGTAAKAIGAGIAAAATGVAALTTSAVKAYADYEQLTGGVETLFKNSSDVVMGYAENAYKTAGLSANEYMKTVTGFSASLLQSLDGDTAAAAEKANTAITDMADNANKMGTSMESIQNAYQGFAKQNYTMLDNLKLGYGGTKEEMARLLADAEKLSGQKFDLSSYSDIVDAIHVVQTEMHISGLSAEEAAEKVRNGEMTQKEAFEAMGTTAKEASTTIQGSLGMLKSSWQNLVTGFANPDADIGKLIGDMVESGKTFLSNLIPAIKQALVGIGQAVKEIAPIIAEELPSLISETLPALLDAATTLVSGLVAALPTILQVLVDQAPMIIMTLIDAIVSMAPMLVELGLNLILSLAQGIIDNLDSLIPAVLEAILKIVDTLTNPDTLSKLIDAALKIIQGLVDGLINALPQLIPAAIQIIMAVINGLIQALPKLIAMLPTLIERVIQALIDNLPLIIDAIIQITMAIIQAIIENLPLFIDAAIQIVTSLTMGLIQAIPDIVSGIVQLLGELVNTIISSLPKFLENGVNLVKHIVEGIVKALPTLLTTGLQAMLKFIEAIASTFVKIKETGAKVIHNIWEGIKSLNPLEWGRDLMDSFIKGIKQKIENLKGTIKNIAQSIKNLLGFSEPSEGPLSNFHTYAPDMMDLFMQGIEDNKKKLQDTVANAFNFQPLMTPTYEISGNGGSQDILERIAAYLPQIANQNIILDTGVLVGATVKQYDEALGKLTTNRARSV